MSVVSVKDVQDVAWLARVQLHDGEVQRLASQLDEILHYVRQLQALPTEGIEPTSHVVTLSNVTRPDQTAPSPAPEEMLVIAPARHGPFFKVPKVVDQAA
ncbi:MAG: Asp-tRNA(Asn)/Glu-tRNA(Gln) amidotransferase subunit GatC [Candidatus Omnitrophica bacterium]|nr:Asp-tRNA(Asn)/Glu-tRNA(Gln) amidotransferase subunit GatC [Candidatus Omnitrophota bacterium]